MASACGGQTTRAAPLEASTPCHVGDADLWPGQWYDGGSQDGCGPYLCECVQNLADGGAELFCACPVP